MELGNILGKFKPKEVEVPKKFLALVLTDEVVQAAVWHVVNGQAETTALGTPVEWDGDAGTTSELITAVDATISSATEGLSDEPNEVIFGVPHTWTDKTGILGSKREFIKNISRELELKPLGFVVITDSILSYLKIQEGTPTTSILMQVSQDELTLVLVRLGRIEAIETIGRSDDVVEDTIEGIARFKASDNLPSRIILFNSMHNLDEIIQSLLSIDWQSQFNFLHIPKVEALPKDITIRALAVAGGAEVAKSLGFTLSEPRPENTTENLEERSQPVSTKEQVEERDDELVSAQDIGFSVPVSMPTTTKNNEVVDTEEAVSVEKKPRPTLKLPALNLPHFTLPKLKFNLVGVKKHVWLVLGAIVIIALLVFWLIWMIPSAHVNVRVTPKSLEQEVALTLSTTASAVDVTSSVVPAKLETTSGSGEKMVETTGKKTVGDPASGDVTIYNRTSLTKTFTKGTTIASGNLKFTLDGDVTVASSSSATDAQLNTTITPGKATVGVTAVAIGTDSNLPASTEFTISNFGKESYVGKNDVALGGGTSEEIQVVDKADQAALVKALTEELLATLASTAVSANTPGVGVYVIPSSTEITAESYSAKVGEKATSLSGKLTLSASLLRYQTEDVTTLINSLIDQSVPSGYMRTELPATVELSAESISETGETVKGTAKVKVALLPVIDTAALQDDLRGKNSSEIEAVLRSNVPGFQDASAQIIPLWLPPRFKAMPYNAGKISITMVPTPSE